MLQKPFNLSLRGKTIDGNEANEVTWQVSGDIQTAYKMDILSNADNSLVWTSNKITSYSLKHTIPSSSLSNGNEYKIQVSIWNQSGSSIASDYEIFQTSSRPVVTIDPIGTVNSFSYVFSSVYTQAENVSLRNYIANLYDEKKNLIDKSNIKTILPMEHLFSNLQTEKQYYIEFQATSSKGLTGTSGLISFDVFYYRPKMNVNMEAKNIDSAGIEISWFVRQIIGGTDGSQFVNNEKIDASDGTKVWLDEGFDIENNFTLKIWLENIPSKKDLLTMQGNNGKLLLRYDAVLEKFTLSKEINKGKKDRWYSNVVTGDSYVVLIQQIGTNMNISAEAIL